MHTTPESTAQAPDMTMRCRACSARIEKTDQFCRYCGKRQYGGKTPWYYEPIIVILIGFFVLGAFAVPLVFRSPKFTPAAKWTLSFLLIVYTVVVVGTTLWSSLIIWNRFAELGRIQGMY